MTQSIPLITTRSGVELVTDAIAEILATETAAQQALAAAASLDPDDWKFLVYKERSRPWELFRDGEVATPFVNIWYESDNTNKSKSNATVRQTVDSRFHIDCYANAVTTETADGQIPGDEAAAALAKKIGWFVYQFLMHDKYERLTDTVADDVWERWVTNRQLFVPSSGQVPIQNVIGFRVTLEVTHNEHIVLEEPVNLEYIGVEYREGDDGQLVAELLYEV